MTLSNSYSSFVSSGSANGSGQVRLQQQLARQNCPLQTYTPQNTQTGKPNISSISPDTALIGSSNVQLTINGEGFGSSPTVNLPSGFTSNGQSSTTTRIVLIVSIALSATIGPNNITVTAGGQTSNNASFTVDGPAYMVVQSDVIGKCDGCSTTVERDVTYQIFNASESSSGAIPICEVVSNSGWNCQQSSPVVSTTSCSDPGYATSTGMFTDGWTLGSDAYTPTGCGDNTVDHWQWDASPSVQKTFGTLTGYLHTNAISINGYVNPPTQMPAGTVIRP